MVKLYSIKDHLDKKEKELRRTSIKRLTTDLIPLKEDIIKRKEDEINKTWEER